MLGGDQRPADFLLQPSRGPVDEQMKTMLNELKTKCVNVGYQRDRPEFFSMEMLMRADGTQFNKMRRDLDVLRVRIEEKLRYDSANSARSNIEMLKLDVEKGSEMRRVGEDERKKGEIRERFRTRSQPIHNAIKRYTNEMRKSQTKLNTTIPEILKLLHKLENLFELHQNQNSFHHAAHNQEDDSDEKPAKEVNSEDKVVENGESDENSNDMRPKSPKLPPSRLNHLHSRESASSSNKDAALKWHIDESSTSDDEPSFRHVASWSTARHSASVSENAGEQASCPGVNTRDNAPRSKICRHRAQEDSHMPKVGEQDESDEEGGADKDASSDSSSDPRSSPTKWNYKRYMATAKRMLPSARPAQPIHSKTQLIDQENDSAASKRSRASTLPTNPPTTLRSGRTTRQPSRFYDYKL